MIEKDPESSQDLFGLSTEETAAEKLKYLLRTRKDAVVHWTPEHLTAWAAVLAVVMVMMFYLGYLRGKLVIQADIQQKIDLLKSRHGAGPVAHPETSVDPGRLNASSAQVLNAAVPTNDTARERSPVAKTPLKPYTIQVVAYRSQDRALNEISKLKRLGYTTHIIAQNEFFIISVGDYISSQEARTDLNTLKRKYPDCYLRKF